MAIIDAPHLALHHHYWPSSTSSSCSLKLDFVSDTLISDTPSFDDTSIVRPKEHLAVLLPKHLWKVGAVSHLDIIPISNANAIHLQPDSRAAFCETIACQKRFSLLERRHHCRKCGGIFCATCSSRTTSLLDTSNLDFIHPPRGISIAQFASPISALYIARVCNACYEQLHGLSTSHSSEVSHAAQRSSIDTAPLPAPPPLSCCTSPRSSSIILTPPESQPISPVIAAIRRPSFLCEPQSRISLQAPADYPEIPKATTPSGELDAYPLRVRSEVCKRTGGGRWTPKKHPVDSTACIPGRRPFWEVEMDLEEERQRRARESQIVRDGGVFSYFILFPGQAIPC